MASVGPIEVNSTEVAELVTPEKALTLELPKVLQDGLAFWNTARGEERFPSRDAIDPLQLRGLLPSILLWEVLEDAPKGHEFVVRLAGANATLGGSRRFKGHTLVDFHGDRFEPIWLEFQEVRTNGLLHYADRTANWDGLPYGQFRRILFPFGEGETVTHLMSVISFERIDPAPEELSV